LATLFATLDTTAHQILAAVILFYNFRLNFYIFVCGKRGCETGAPFPCKSANRQLQNSQKTARQAKTSSTSCCSWIFQPLFDEIV